MKEIEIPEGYTARIDGNKVIIELKEGEDERIRKELVAYLKGELAPGQELIKQWIAYLEKQKEQKPEISTKTEIEYADRYSHDVWEKLMSKFKAIEGYSIGCNDVSDIVLNAILNAFKWQKDQKEQKPIDESKAKEEFIDIIERANLVGRSGMTLIERDKQAWWEDFKDSVNCVIKQQPAEWSEKDEGMLNCIIATLCEESHGGREANHKMVTWLGNRLKSLRPQPKNEWNKEDETMWSNLIGYLDGKFGMLPSGKERYIKWLTERFVKLVYPKPHWKPNNEQIEVYTDAIYFLAKHGFKDPNGVLESLYNDIKKL